MIDYEELAEAMGDLDEDTVKELLETVMADGGSGAQQAMDACQKGMDIVGSRFESGEYFVGDLIYAGELMTDAVSILKDALVTGDGGGTKTKMILCTVKDDLHDIGKNLVRMMMEGKGLNVIDLGVDAGIVDKSGAWFAFGAEKLGQGKEKVRALLDETPELRNAIESQLIEHLGMNPRPVVHAPEETLPDPENAPVDDMDDEI